MSPTRISLGTAQLGLPYGIAGRRDLMPAAEAEALLDTALECGVTALDTAAAYGCAEQRIGDFLARSGGRDRFQLCSKLSAAVPPGRVGAEVRSSLQRLRVDRIDEFLIHEAADLRRHGAALIDALSAEVDAGLIGRFGISAYAPSELKLVQEYPQIELAQHPFSLFDRRLLTSLPTKLELHGRSALLQGLLTMDPEGVPAGLEAAVAPLQRLEQLAGEYGTTRRRLALAFVAAAPRIDRIVIGVDSARQLRDNVDALATPVSPERFDALVTAIGELPAELIDPRRWPEIKA